MRTLVTHAPPQQLGLPSPLWTPLTMLVMTSTALFSLTLLLGVWAAYDQATALLRCAVIGAGLAAMVVIGWTGRYHAKTMLGLAGVGCALVAGVLSLAYGLGFTHNSGAVASSLMVLLPLGASGIWWQWVAAQKRLAWLAGSAWLVGLVSFGVTLERTAWLGLVSGLVGAGYLIWRVETASSARMVGHVGDWLVGLALLSGLVGYGLLCFTPTADSLLPHTAIAAAVQERSALWRESLAMCDDYYFTGSGLGMTAMVYSTYVLAIHVPYWYHAHQLYIQIALEQGVPGLLAFLGMVLPLLGMLVTTYRASSPYTRPFCLSAMTALLAVVSYGFLDAELYATALVVVLFMPLGFGLALYWATLNRQATMALTPAGAPSVAALGGAGMLPILLVVLCCVKPGAGALLYTNMGVLSQTKSELSHYQWPTWPIQDALRRRGAVDLVTALAYYQAALTLAPDNATVHQRLGQIALSQGNYAVALAQLRQAYQTEPERASLHRLLGEAYAVTGDITAAAVLWQTVEMPQGHIEDRLWWYGSLHAQQEVQWVQQALAHRQL